MASVYQPKVRKIYRIEFRDQFGRYRKTSSGTKDKSIAESLAKKIEEDAGRIASDMPLRHLEITAFFLGLVTGTAAERRWPAFRKRYEAEYLDAQRTRSRAKGRMVLDIFEQECQPKTLLEIDEKTISTFAARLR